MAAEAHVLVHNSFYDPRTKGLRLKNCVRDEVVLLAGRQLHIGRPRILTLSELKKSFTEISQLQSKGRVVVTNLTNQPVDLSTLVVPTEMVSKEPEFPAVHPQEQGLLMAAEPNGIAVNPFGPDKDLGAFNAVRTAESESATPLAAAVAAFGGKDDDSPEEDSEEPVKADSDTGSKTVMVLGQPVPQSKGKRR